MKQSPNDPKAYQALTLENGLRVLISQNTDSNKAAAALAVNVGHFSDPIERQGMAHFLEHMLFLGTQKYPNASEYQKFISQYGGSHNAWTATEHTCFFFDIQQHYFDEALDRFSQFFIAPLLSQEFIDKERQNVDAEFKLKLKDDIRRLYDVHKETINPQHPFAKFSVGNIDTLADRQGVTVRDEVAAFFMQHYRAGYMTLAVEGPQPLDELETLVREKFAKLKPAESDRAPITEPLYLPQHLAIKLSVKPVKNDRKLIVSFAMPSIDQFYRHKPEAILSYLLGHEGPGSILSLLKNQQWAMALTAGSGINGSNFKDFNITMTLTELGEQHIDDIITVIFQYIDLLKAQPLPNFYYQEKQALAELSFLYQEHLTPLDSVCQAVLNMQHYPPEDYIFGNYAMAGMCQDSIDELLSYLVAKNMRIIHVSQNNQFSRQSRWYQVPYQQQQLANEQLMKWQNSRSNPALKLPEPNPYIVASPEVYENTDQKLLPYKLRQDNGLTIWFKQDNSFKVPKGHLFVGIDIPTAVASPANTAMTRLFSELFSDAVVEQHYNAELAGIHYHLYTHQGGMTLQMSGLSEKQGELLSQLLQQLVNFECQPERFELFKQQLLRHWQNADKSKSISQLFSVLSSTMQPNNPSSAALAAALTDISLQQFLQFSRQLFDQVALEVLIHGNWQPQHGQHIAEQVAAVFAGKHDRRHVVDCPVIDMQTQGEVILPLLLPEHDHASIVYYPLANRDIALEALTMLTSQLLSPLFFQQMRTERQYGYLVGVGYIPINRYPGIAFYIQSPHTKALDLTDAIDDFIAHCNEQLETMDNEDWHNLQQGLASQLREKDTSLGIKSQRFWLSICHKDTDFSHQQALINAILSTTRQQVQAFLSESLNSSLLPDRINLISLKNNAELSEKPQLEAKIKSVEDFAKISVKTT